jgi:1-acyl-sn-glycerol-3-phosphate acyltransferase
MIDNKIFFFHKTEKYFKNQMDWFLIVIIFDILLFSYLFSIPTLLVFLSIYPYLIPRESKSFRSLNLWNFLRKDITIDGPGKDLLKSKDQYIFAIHKHGLYSTAVITYFALNNKMLHVKPVGTSALFWFPFIKELVSLAGCIPANRDDMVAELRRGSSLALAPGGIREIPGMDHREFVERNGFIKIACQQQVAVVPIYVDGEEETYKVIILFPEWAKWLLHKVYYPFGCIFAWGHPWLPFWPKTLKMRLVVGKSILVLDEKKMKEMFYSSLRSLKSEERGFDGISERNKKEN